MRLKSFGCSFIFGTDLGDEYTDTTLPLRPSQKTWPALLAKKLSYEYRCYAKPGSGNLQILDQVLNQVTSSNSQDFFIIGWTWIDRFDYYDNNFHPSKKVSPWSTILPIDKNQVAKNYFKTLHSEYRDKLCSLVYVKTAIDILREKQIPFIMTYMDPLMFNQDWNLNFGILELQRSINPCMTTFDGMNFLEWSRKNQYPESDFWHPLDQAHCAAADYMIKVFDKQKTNDPVQQVLV